MQYFEVTELVAPQRKELGLTQSELGEASNTSRSTVFRIENGEEVNSHALFDVLNALNIELEVRERETMRPK